MKVLILTNYENSWPYIPELVEELMRHNISVDILDIFGQKFISQQSAKSILPAGMRGFMGVIERINPLKKIVKVATAFYYLSRSKPRYDVVNIHGVDPVYSLLSRVISNSGKYLVTTVWGSDFYRSKHRRVQRRIFQKANLITFGNPATRDQFLKYYNDFHTKTRICPFGIRNLELMKIMLSTYSKAEVKKQMGIEPDTTVICCGYNNTPEQQHELIIQSIKKAKQVFAKKITLVFPMTYPKNAKYLGKIKKMLSSLGISFKVYKEFMTLEDTTRLRCVSDIVINLQQTDQLSASIQEHLFGRCILIVGDWLPYEILKQRGVFLLQTTVPELPDIIENCLLDYRQYSSKTDNNMELIYKYSSWESRIDDWISLYENAVGD